MSLVAIAIGGNALRTEDGVGAPSEWFDALAAALPPLADLVAAGHRLVLSHGNGPQVGEELLRMEIAKPVMPALTLDLCVAETEGSLGYAIQQVLATCCGSEAWRRVWSRSSARSSSTRPIPRSTSPPSPSAPFTRKPRHSATRASMAGR